MKGNDDDDERGNRGSEAVEGARGGGLCDGGANRVPKGTWRVHNCMRIARGCSL